MTENKPIIYYKKDCFNEPYCSLKEVIEELSRKTQECEELKRELMQFEKDVKDLNYYSIKLKQVLQQIKEIVNIKQEQSVYVLPSVLEQILQIIDEVE